MKRRDFFRWLGVGVAVAAVPAPVRALVQAVTPVSVKKRLLTVILVDQFGKGDAKTIQEGIDMLPPEGGHVIVGTGIYSIDKAIELKGNVNIVGGGAQIDMGADDIAAFKVSGEENRIQNFVVCNPKNYKNTTFIQELRTAARNIFFGNANL